MKRIEKSIEVRCPAQAAYDRWTRFEQAPSFMTGVREVRRIDDRHLHWYADLFGKGREWDAEIVELVPGERVAWRSTTTGMPYAESVDFEPIDADRTRVALTVEYNEQGAYEVVTNAFGAVDGRIEKTMRSFKELMEE